MQAQSIGLSAQGLFKKYGKHTVVQGIDMAVNPGEIVGLLGPNGAGKTTTFYMIVGLLAPNSGDVFLGKEAITALPMYKRARLGIGYLPQEPSIFRRLSVEDNLLAVAERAPGSGKEHKQIALKYAKELELTHLLKQQAYTLSGGERRRLEIARALVLEPRFLLMDEPFSGVDPISVHEVQNLVIQLKARGIGILITDHNVRETLSITDRAYLMYEGKILCEGTPKAITENPESKKRYLGEQFQLN